MSKVIKKFISTNSVGSNQIRLENNSSLKARNAADSADVNLFKLNASNISELANTTIYPTTVTGATGQELANVNYVNSVVASGLVSQNLSSTVTFSTTSATYVQVTSFVLTPSSGTYAVWCNFKGQLSSNGAINYASFYKNTTQVTDSERLFRSGSNTFDYTGAMLSVINFNGTDELRMYVRVSTGTLTLTNRTLMILRLGA